MAYIYNLADTWNAGATIFTAIKMNVTDTASAATSLLMDLQVGAGSKFSVSKTGAVISAAGFAANGTDSPRSYAIANSTNARGLEFFTGGNRMYYRESNSTILSLGSGTGIMLTNIEPFGWAATTADGVADTVLRRDAANTLAQRNGVNAQTFNLYGTYTDGSNYRRLTKTMSTGGVAVIKPEGAGTGASGNVLHISGLPTSNPGPGILWNNAGTPAIGT